MYEIHFLIWPFLYGLAGFTWGALLGHPIIGALLGVVLGYVTAFPLSWKPEALEAIGCAPYGFWERRTRTNGSRRQAAKRAACRALTVRSAC